MPSPKPIRGKILPIDAPLPWLLMRVLRKEPDPELRYSVRRNVWPEEAEIKFARSATKHRISRERSLHVVENCGLQFVNRNRDLAKPDADRRVVFFGDDLEGVAIEVMAAEEEEDRFLAIHAMHLRNRFRGLYEEARLWAK